jgi:colanic acid/amylovoran biosynthesis glycosyltransferase
MRILVFVERFMFITQTFVYNEINKLAEHHEVKLLTTERLNEEKSAFKDVVLMPLRQTALRRRLFWELERRDLFINRKNKAFSKKVNELIVAFKPDVIHGHFGYETMTLLDNLNPTSIPIFITFHGYDASQMLSRKSYISKMNSFFQKFNVIPTTVSRYMKSDLIQAGMKVKNARINYCGIDIQHFSIPPITIPSKYFIFLQIASFSEKKGHVYTLKAFRLFLSSQIDKKKYRLILAGAWDLFEEIKRLCTELGLDEYVEFPGAVNPSQAYTLLSQADVFVHHSIVASNGDKEGIPNAVMEAMAMQLPVLSTLHSGIPELVEDGVNGYLVAEKDVEGYAKRMADILSWGKLDRNREKIKQQFSLEPHTEHLLSMYREAIASKPA